MDRYEMLPVCLRYSRTIYQLNDYSVYFLANFSFTDTEGIAINKDKLTQKRESVTQSHQN